MSSEKDRLIDWLKGFKRTHSMQEFLSNHKFTDDELAFLKVKLVLTPKKDKKRTAEKWG